LLGCEIQNKYWWYYDSVRMISGCFDVVDYKCVLRMTIYMNEEKIVVPCAIQSGMID